MSARIDHARRLELSDVRDVGDFVSGRARGLTVSLEGAAPFAACVVELDATIPLARMRMSPEDLNHPDAVETGDGAFDEPMQVMSLPTYAPTLEQLLATRRVRAAVRKFFGKYPDAEFTGTKLRVPAGAEGVTQRMISDALEVSELLVRRFAELGSVSTEPRATLPEGMRDPTPWRQLGGVAWAFGALGLGVYLTQGLSDPLFLVGGMVLIVLGGVVSIIAGDKKNDRTH